MFNTPAKQLMKHQAAAAGEFFSKFDGFENCFN